MSVSFTLTANNTQELVSNLKLCLALLEPAPIPAPVPAGDVVVVAETKGKGGRKKQAESPAPVQTDIEEVTSAPAPEPTYDDATAALRDLNQKHGMQSVRVLLGEFGYEKVNQMKPENYGAIIEKAKAQTAA